MESTVIKKEKRLCTCCMEEHEVKTVLVREQTIFKNRRVTYEASYLYCDTAMELYTEEQQMQENDIRMKDAYRRIEGLLTSEEIRGIRTRYGISQSDLCTLLGWGGKTITRYESHQVQDKAHDTILKKIAHDPEWFLSLLREAKNSLSADSYGKYLETGTSLYEKERDFYLRRAIEASYAKYYGEQKLHGNTELSLDKVVDVIRYFAFSEKVSSLYKVKLMKLLWYADALSFKKRGFAITGMVYQALPMGAVPVAHDAIIALQGVPCEEEYIKEEEIIAYHFSLNEEPSCPALSNDDKGILDIVIEKLGKMSKRQIVSFMHMEQAYIRTAQQDAILFEYAKNLQI